MTSPPLSADLCLKCNICTAACPVAAVTDLFDGPKAVGPQMQRFRHPDLPPPPSSVEWCSGCGTCSRVCPHGVAVAEMNIQAKHSHALVDGVPIRDQFISRPELLGKLAAPIAPIANLLANMPVIRSLLEKVFGISRHAPLPRFSARTLRSRMRRLQAKVPPEGENIIAYFHGCSANYYEPKLGMAAVAVLRKLGYEVILPPQNCCGLPLQSNGLFDAARKLAAKNLEYLAPFAEKNIPIIGTSTSCILAIKHEYRTILGLDTVYADVVAANAFDIFEFLTMIEPESLSEVTYHLVGARAIYHPPCQLMGHGIGTPAEPVLRRIPGLELHRSQCTCCGVAGTYGVKKEKYQVAIDVGRVLFEQAKSIDADFIITDSETCRWWITRHTGLPAYHPIEVLSRAMDVR
jgi:glycerol-3-phosphate dehydrogenase subunit C